MFLTGIADEAGAPLDTQIKATKELGWQYIEARMVEVPGYPAGNIHDISIGLLYVGTHELCPTPMNSV